MELCYLCGGIAAGAIGGAVGSIASQGLGIALGVQDRINWKGVGLAAIGGGLGAGVMSAFSVRPIAGDGGSASAANIAANLGRSMAGNLANAAARSVIEGSDFGDNVLAALPDTIAQTMVDVAMRTVARGGGGGGADGISVALQSFGVGAAAVGSSMASAIVSRAGSISNPDEIVVTGRPSQGLLLSAVQPGEIPNDDGIWVNQAAIDQAISGPRSLNYRYFSDTVDRLQAQDRAARTAARGAIGASAQTQSEGPEIVVTGKRMSKAGKAAYNRNHSNGVMTIAAGGIPSRYISATANWTSTFNSIGSAPGLPLYLRTNNYIGSPERNQSFIDDIKDRDGVWQIDRVILPGLAMHLDDPDVKFVHDGLRTYVDDINSRADAETNRWAGQAMFLGIGAPLTLAATAASGGTLILAYGEGGIGALSLSGVVGTAVGADYSQAHVRGILNGEFSVQSTIGGTWITEGSERFGVNRLLGYKVDGEPTYAVGNLLVGGYGAVRYGLSRLGPAAAESAPILPKFVPGGKTLGVLRTPQGDIPITSGWTGPSSAMPKGSPGFDIVSKSHVEGHASAIMHQEGLTDATLFINNPAVCASCTSNLPRMLPSGSNLNVVLPDGTVVPFTGK